MPVSLDLNILPILRQGGQDQTDFPGLYAVTPPRRTARGRDQDNLVLYLTLTGNMRVPPEYQVELLTRAAQKFYKTSGTVTSALRSLAEMINQVLLERNLRTPGAQLIGFLSQVVLRVDTATLAHSGPCQAFYLTPAEVQESFDIQTSGRGLGLSRSPTLRYFQHTVQPNEFLLLTHQPAQDWQLGMLRVSPNQGMEGLRRRLLVGRTEPNLNAVLIQVVSGDGKLRFLRLKTNLPEMARPQVGAADNLEQEQAPVEPVRENLPLEVPVALASSASDLPVDDQPQDVEREPPDIVESQVPEVEQPIPERMDADTAGQDSPESEPPKQPVSEAGPVLAPTEAAQASIPAETLPVEQPPTRSEVAPSQPPTPRGKQSVQPASSQPPKKRTFQFDGPRRFFSALLGALAVIQTAFANSAQQLGKSLFVMLGRLLPDESMLSISPRTLLFIAIAIPLLVGVVGGVVYIERGQTGQYQLYYDQALQTSAAAFEKTDPIEQRLAWQSTIELLDKAELYRITPESQALRSVVQDSLDMIDGIERLDFKPALNINLDRATNITKLVTNGGDLYMLNGAQGNVIRAVLTGGGYQPDPQFNCGPVAGGSAVVGPIVDIVPLVRGDATKATVMGIDSSGTLIFCVPGDQPLIQPVNPPASNFDEVRAFDWNNNTLYLLDPGSNAVWFYESRDIAVPPRLFFGEDIPYMLDVIDLVVSNRDLYLLHADGHQTFCVYQVETTRCQDPLEYGDLRPGRTGGPVIPDAIFTQMQFAPPPDPSLFLLEPKSQAVYHFSLRLVLQRQYQPKQPLGEGPLTAFTVSPARSLFLAQGHQVFVTQLP